MELMSNGHNETQKTQLNIKFPAELKGFAGFFIFIESWVKLYWFNKD